MSRRPSAAAPSRRQWILLVCLFLASLPAVTPRIYSSDEIQYFSYLRSLWFDHDLSFENEYQYFYDRGVARSEGFHETFLERQTDTGRRLNFGTIGCAILWSPFYAVGHAAAKLSGAPQDGFSRPYVAAVAYGSALYGFLAVVLAIACAARLGLNGFAAAVALWLGTPLLFYMYVAPPFSHACSAFAVALFTWVWLRVRHEWSPAGLAALGAAGALMAMTREQDAFFVAGPAVDFALQVSRRPRVLKSSLAGLFAAAACFLVAYSPQLVSYKIVNGHFGPHASVANKMKWYAPHALPVLFSLEHGYFIWTPLAVLGLAGLFFVPPEGGSYPDGAVPPEGGSYRTVRPEGGSDRTVRPEGGSYTAATPEGGSDRAGDRRRNVAIGLLLMFVLQVYIGGSVDSWTVAGGFGQRRFVALTTVLVIGLSSLGARVAATKGRRWMSGTLAVLAVYWNLALTAEFATGLMDRQRLEPPRNAYDAFVTLPRLAPQLAYRYLFDRQSFYRAHPLSR